MEIRPSRASRIFLLIGGLSFAALWIALAMVGNIGREPLWVYLLWGWPVALGIGVAVAGVRPSYLSADDSNVTYHPPIGRTKSAPRSSLSRIVRVSGGRGLATVEFRDGNGHRMFRTGMSFSQDDMERLAEYVGVRCYWNFGADSTIGTLKPGASWEEVKAHLDPDIVKEAEKHLKQ